MKKIFYSALFISLCLTSRAQDKPSPSDDLLNMSLEELMNIEIVSASKSAENLFDAPFSASVLTKEEIQRSGSNSIMEALRLVPGLIVREQTNGNYDIHLRGLDNVPPNSTYIQSANTTTLVMIDNRPVYNYFQGGTFWESLPVDLNDVERIEVVRGPVSAMYGPNAVSGVINIITRKPEKDGVYAVANAQGGSHKTYISNASVGYRFNDKINFIVSGNGQNRDRHQTSYYEIFRNTMVHDPKELMDSFGRPNGNPEGRYPDQSLAMQKYGANGFLNFTPAKEVNFELAAGLQDSKVQKIYGESQFTALSTASTQSRYLDVKAAVKGLSGQISLLGGQQTPGMGLTGMHWDYNTVDAQLEYAIKLKNLSIKPGINYRKAVYDDSNYWNVAIKEGYFNGRRELVTQAASLRADYRALGNKLRLIAGGRVDHFTYPKKAYFSYQLAANYKQNDKHLFRLVHSRANRSPFIADTYLDFIVAAYPVGPNTSMELYIGGNKNLKLLTSNMFEAGYRGKLAKNMQVDIELFATNTKNFTNDIETPVMPRQEGNQTILRVPILQHNLPLSVRELGTTVSLNYVLGKLQLKPFATLQQTKLYDYSPYNNLPEVAPSPSNLMNPDQNNLYSGVGTVIKHKSTPGVFGGAFINYQPHAQWNINLNPYFYRAQTFYHRFNSEYHDGERGVDNISSKLILNARVSYNPVKQVSVFVNARNLTNDRSVEFYRADGIKASYLGGINFSF